MRGRNEVYIFCFVCWLYLGFVRRAGIDRFAEQTRSASPRQGTACCRGKETKRNFSFIALFTDEKRGKSHLRGLSSLLKNTPCRLAATGANTLPRPSRYSLTAATGSKRSSADSDLLLCHVRLWQTSRSIFVRKYWCEHSEIEVCFGNTLIVTPHPSRQTAPTSPTGEGLSVHSA